MFEISTCIIVTVNFASVKFLKYDENGCCFTCHNNLILSVTERFWLALLYRRKDWEGGSSLVGKCEKKIILIHFLFDLKEFC